MFGGMNVKKSESYLMLFLNLAQKCKKGRNNFYNNNILIVMGALKSFDICWIKI